MSVRADLLQKYGGRVDLYAEVADLESATFDQVATLEGTPEEVATLDRILSA